MLVQGYGGQSSKQNGRRSCTVASSTIDVVAWFPLQGPCCVCTTILHKLQWSQEAAERRKPPDSKEYSYKDACCMLENFEKFAKGCQTVVVLLLGFVCRNRWLQPFKQVNSVAVFIVSSFHSPETPLKRFEEDKA